MVYILHLELKYKKHIDIYNILTMVIFINKTSLTLRSCTLIKL